MCQKIMKYQLIRIEYSVRDVIDDIHMCMSRNDAI